MKSQTRAVCMLSGVVISLSLFSGVACGPAKSPAELESGLTDPDPQVRRHSADGLRSHDNVPAEAIPKLIAAINQEQDMEAYGAEMITLGASGVPEAKPYICKKVGDGDIRMSRWANHAQMAWLKKNPNSNGCSGVSTVPEVPKNAPPGSEANAPKSM